VNRLNRQPLGRPYDRLGHTVGPPEHKRQVALRQVWMPEFRKGRLPGGNPALCLRSSPHALQPGPVDASWITLVPCPVCNSWLELLALKTHIALRHQLQVLEGNLSPIPPEQGDAP